MIIDVNGYFAPAGAGGLSLSVASNLAIVPTSNGSVSAFADTPTHLVLDISAFFAP